MILVLVAQERNIRTVAERTLNINTLKDFIKMKKWYQKAICHPKYKIKAKIR